MAKLKLGPLADEKSVKVSVELPAALHRDLVAYSPETCRKVSAACRFIKSLSAEARKYYLAERKSRWLTNCIVERGDIKTFDLAGVDPQTGRRFSVHIEMPSSATLLDFLLLVMNCADAPMTMRLDAGKNAAPLMHALPKPVIMVERKRARLSASVATDEANPAVAEG